MCSVIKKLNRMQKAFLLVEKKTSKYQHLLNYFGKKYQKVIVEEWYLENITGPGKVLFISWMVSECRQNPKKHLMVWFSFMLFGSLESR
jgi:hypothetical protein